MKLFQPSAQTATFTAGEHERYRPVYDSAAVKSQAAFELKELWRYRFLVRNLIARDLKVRYKRSVLGFVWVMLNPLLTMAVLTVVFTQLFRFSVPHYPVYLLIGLIMWNLFAQGSVAAMSNLLGNGSVLRRMYIPPSVFVASSVGSALVNLLFALIPFFLLALVTGVRPSLTWPLIIVPCIAATIFTFGIGLIVAAFMVFFTDTFEMYTVFLNIYNFVTPVFYPVSILPPPLQKAEQFNPMFLFMDEVRKFVIAGQRPAFHEIGILMAVALGTFAVGWLIFTRLEGKFANHF